MKTNLKGIHLFGLIGVVIVTQVLLFNACVSRVRNPVSVFDNEGPFQVDQNDKDVLIYQNPKIKVTSYSKFLIEPVKIYSNEHGHGIKPEEEKALTESFRLEFIQAMQGYPIVEEAGPGVLRIRTAILDIQPAHLEFDEDKFIVLRMDTLLTRVSMELECVDSVTGEKVAALIHRLWEQEFQDTDKKTRLLNVREAFSDWTRSLRARLDHARTQPEGGFDGLNAEEYKRLREEEGQ